MSIPKEPEQVMKQRGGSVLGKKTILKSDHFPGCQNKRLSPHIDGAPNYRQVLFTFYPIPSHLFLAADCCMLIGFTSFDSVYLLVS